jgi:hypothetical protein
LIAIGIIGVVSALTIPTLVKNYQQRQTIVQLKKVYSLLNQAVRASVDDNGDVDDWTFSLSNNDFMTKYFAPYIKVSNLSGVTHKFESLDGTSLKKTCSVLSGGEYICLCDHWAMKNHLLIDINGASGPNRVGRDLFLFTFWNNKLISYSQISIESERALCNSVLATITKGGTMGQCNKTAAGGMAGAGSYCSTVIYCNNWSFPKKYPWN